MRACSRVVFALWALLAFVVATSLAAAHVYTLPKPVAWDSSLRAALASLREPADAKRWLAVHVLYAQCRCSRRVLEHLASSRRPAAAREKLLLVGNTEQQVTARGLLEPRRIRVLGVTPETLRERFHIEAAPLLLVLDADDVVRYAGGYSERKQGLSLQDAEIIAKLMARRRPAELPLFGCAVSDRLQRVLDPVYVITPPR